MARRYRKVAIPKKGFPTFAALLFLVGVLWLLTELEIIKVDIPWLPVILIVIAIGMLANRKK